MNTEGVISKLFHRPDDHIGCLELHFHLTDERVLVGTVCLAPVVFQRLVEQHAVHGRPRSRLAGSPARVRDRFEVVLRRPHPALVTYHVVTTRPPAVALLVV